MHIPKTGGSAIRITLSGENKLYTSKSFKSLRFENKIYFNDHNFKLSDCLDDERIFFSFRDNITRFQSAFYSRKRCGKPLNNVPWNDLEKIVFSNFNSPDDFVQAIIRDEKYLGGCNQKSARTLFMDIPIFSRGYSYYFKDIEYLETKKKNIFYILNI